VKAVEMMEPERVLGTEFVEQMSF